MSSTMGYSRARSWRTNAADSESSTALPAWFFTRPAAMARFSRDNNAGSASFSGRWSFGQTSISASSLSIIRGPP